MPLAPGTRLGPYEIAAPLGSGGMGEVYRARDPRLERDVAVKVLLANVSGDPERLQRFEQEARATGMLNHPNIVAVYDVGAHDGAPYVVTELLVGRTLRDVLREGPLPPQKAVEFGIQIAAGVQAAHERGIVHRDLKPENVFVTKGGLVKILDFGLVKLKQRDSTAMPASERPTYASATQPGMLLGTIGYMAPEQVRGQVADQRSDIFAIGVLVYEMLVGRPAFQRESAAETISAILKEDPPDPATILRHVPPVLVRIVRRCIEKEPSERFQSAHDVALALEAMSATSPAEYEVFGAWRRAWRGRGRAVAAAIVMLCLVAAAGYLIGRDAAFDPGGAPELSFRRLTFQRGWISAARFAPDPGTVLYSASWDGAPPEIFLVRPESAESRPLGIRDADLLSVSRTGELAILQHPQITLNIYHRLGTLARVPLGGGSPRAVLDATRYAAWSATGEDLAVIHDVGNRRRLEYPLGTPLYDTPSTIANTIVAPRVSPDGNLVAFFEGFGARVRRWAVNIVDRAGTRTTLSGDWYDWWLLAWSPTGEEVWFGASEAGSASALHAVTLDGQERLVFRIPGTVELHDVAPDGRVLLSLMSYRTFTRGVPPELTAERDLSWLDASAAVALSRDGRVVVLDEHGQGAGATNAAYLRNTDGSPAVRLGAGRPLALSPDGRWVLTTQPGPPPTLYLLPTGAGETQPLDASRFEFIRTANWFPDGLRLLLSAAEPEGGVRLYIYDLASGDARPVSPEGYDITGDAVSPDGTLIVATGPGDEVVVWTVGHGEPRPLPHSSPGDVPAGWTADGRGLYVFRRGGVPVRIFRVDVDSGARSTWRDFVPPDPAGIGSITAVLITPDGTAGVYSYEQALSELYLIQGLD